ncbi:hypothetical protein, partial [Umezawaea sp. NPDC059074]|uniref:hypothetical protein n=1 Tax=Umezawaea sp. NPDC059074 TaxID=3346716 RepID=UPI0036B649F8
MSTRFPSLTLGELTDVPPNARLRAFAASGGGPPDPTSGARYAPPYTPPDAAGCGRGSTPRGVYAQ